jgi:hypothetical protein
MGMFVKQDDYTSAVVLDSVPRDVSPILKANIIAWNKGMGLDILLRTRDVERIMKAQCFGPFINECRAKYVRELQL